MKTSTMTNVQMKNCYIVKWLNCRQAIGQYSNIAMKPFLLFIFIFHISYFAFSQDPHFSQYNHTPMLINPGMLAMKSEMQLLLNYRSQWANFSTPMATAIFPFLSKKETNQRWGGAGLSFVNDRAGESGVLQTMGVSGGFAYNLSLGNEHYLSSGISLGYIQKQVSVAQLTSGSQWDGSIYDETIPLGDDFQATSVGMEDVSAGIFWYKTNEGKINYYSGISVFHLTQPNESFTKVPSKLPVRIVYYGGLKAFTLAEKIDISPGLLYTNQGKAQEINIGSYFRYNFDESSTGFLKDGSMALAAWYRTNDAVNVGLEVALANFIVGFSYDINVAKDAARKKGAFEIALVLKKTISRKITPKEVPPVPVPAITEEEEDPSIRLSLLITVSDAQTGAGLPATISIKNKSTGAIVQSNNGSGNTLTVPLSRSKTYELTVTKAGYEPYREDISIVGKITASKEYKKNISLKKIK